MTRGRPYPHPPPNAETVLAFPAHIEPLRNVRSTILVASIDNVKSAGHWDDYARRIPEQHRVALFESIAGNWVPVDAAMAHYAACDALGLSEKTAMEFGRRTVDRIGQSMIGTGIRMAKQAGATPWSFFPHMQRFWARGYDGGGIAAYKLGPKEARLDLIQFRLCESAFYRHALCGWMASTVKLFCGTLYLHEKKAPDGPQSLSFRAQWV